MLVRWLHESTCHRHSQFERHVEPCHVVAALTGTPGEIVNGVIAAEQCTENSAKTGIVGAVSRSNAFREQAGDQVALGGRHYPLDRRPTGPVNSADPFLRAQRRLRRRFNSIRSPIFSGADYGGHRIRMRVESQRRDHYESIPVSNAMSTLREGSKLQARIRAAEKTEPATPLKPIGSAYTGVFRPAPPR
jgi:hypothetical protein